MRVQTNALQWIGKCAKCWRRKSSHSYWELKQMLWNDFSTKRCKMLNVECAKCWRRRSKTQLLPRASVRWCMHRFWCSQTITLRKIKIICGVRTPRTPAFWMYGPNETLLLGFCWWIASQTIINFWRISWPRIWWRCWQQRHCGIFRNFYSTLLQDCLHLTVLCSNDPHL